MPAIKKYPTKYCNNCGDPTVEKDCSYKKKNSIVLTLCHKCNKVISGKLMLGRIKKVRLFVY